MTDPTPTSTPGGRTVDARSALLDTWRAAPLAEVAWRRPGGPPEIAVVVPLVAEGRPVVALSYDRLGEARRMATVGHAVAAVHAFAPDEARMATADVSVTEDPTGRDFSDRLLPQELAKHPPSRSLADSLLLRSEHWWYLPRLVITLHPRTGAHHPRRDALVAVDTARGLELTTVDLDGPEHAPTLSPGVPDGPAMVLRHGAEVPDLEGRWRQRWWGTIEDGRLLLDGWDQQGAPGRRPGVWRRWRDEIALSRACRVGLREAGHH
jgi:hypothetical protein